MSGQPILISSWNVNGIRRIIKADGSPLLAYIKSTEPSILFLQETKIEEDEDEQRLSTAINGYHGYFNSLSAHSSGLAVYINNKFVEKLKQHNKEIKLVSVKEGHESPKHFEKGRLITIEFSEFYIINVYVLHSGMKLENLEKRQQFDEYLSNYISKLEKIKPVIVCGDLNVANDDIDLKNPTSNRNKTAGFTDQERDSFKKLLVQTDLIDLYRYEHPYVKEETDKKTKLELTDAKFKELSDSGVVKYTFWSMLRPTNRTNNIGWRLDYFLISRKLDKLLEDGKIKSVIRDDVAGSDHCPVEIKFASV